jgi:23S rRNA G2445 N2-methylase RlmL
MEHFFATCPRGLESTLATELAGLSAQEIKAVDGGVQFTGSAPRLCDWTIRLSKCIIKPEIPRQWWF